MQNQAIVTILPFVYKPNCNAILAFCLLSCQLFVIIFQNIETLAVHFFLMRFRWLHGDALFELTQP